MNGSNLEIERVAAAWLARRDSGHWSQRDEDAFATWMAAETSHRVAFLRLAATWEEIPRLKAFAAGASGLPTRDAWKASPYFAPPPVSPFEGAPDRPRRFGGKPRTRRWPALAAVAAGVFAIGVALAILPWHATGHVERGDWKTAIGGERVVQLADGSSVTLGGDSELRAMMSARNRDVFLERGEAFFSVAHDAGRPFVVHAHGYHVTAVGTRFDVRRDDEGLRVVVTQGRVRLQSAHRAMDPAMVLAAGAIATVTGDRISVRQIAPDEALNQLGWRDGYAVFHDTPLVDAVREFNRYNLRRIVIADPSLDTLRVGGHFRLDNGAAFVRLLEEIFPVRAEPRNGEVVLSRRIVEHRD